jgi:F420H(2)-dependent quinone reductase
MIFELLNELQFLYLTTVGWKTGKQHKIEIWYVKQNRKLRNVRTWRKPHWVRNIRYSPRVFTVNGLDFDGNVR